MKVLLYGLIACMICVVSDAHAAGAPGDSARYSKSSTEQRALSRRAGRVARIAPGISRVPAKRSDKPLELDKPTQVSAGSSPAIDTITSLANGSSPVNPWFPERGAIGVRVQVAW